MTVIITVCIYADAMQVSSGSYADVLPYAYTIQRDCNG